MKVQYETSIYSTFKVDDTIRKVREMPKCLDISKCSVIIGAVNDSELQDFPKAEAVMAHDCQYTYGNEKLFRLLREHNDRNGWYDCTPVTLQKSDEQMPIVDFLKSVGIEFPEKALEISTSLDLEEMSKSRLKKLFSRNKTIQVPIKPCLASAYEKVFAKSRGKEGEQTLTSREARLLANDISRFYENHVEKKYGPQNTTEDDQPKEQPKPTEETKSSFAEMEFDELTDFVDAYIKKMCMDGTIGKHKNVKRMERLTRIGKEGLKTALEENDKTQDSLKDARKLVNEEEDIHING